MVGCNGVLTDWNAHNVDPGITFRCHTVHQLNIRTTVHKHRRTGQIFLGGG